VFRLMRNIAALLIYMGNRHSLVGVVTDYALDERGSIPGKGNMIFLFSVASRLPPEAIQLLNQWVGESFPGIKGPGREADHSPQSSADVNNGGAIPQLSHRFLWRSD
jgi:hypothetical protein